MPLYTTTRTLLTDLFTPVSMYLRMRKRHRYCCLFEGGDSRGSEDGRSFIGFDPIAEYRLEKKTCSFLLPDDEHTFTLTSELDFAHSVDLFLQAVRPADTESTPLNGNGIHGYISWEAIQTMETIHFQRYEEQPSPIPAARFFLFKFILSYNPFRNELQIIRNKLGNAQDSETAIAEEFNALISELFHEPLTIGPFNVAGEEVATQTDSEFKDVITHCKRHIARGDVFQIVPSRRYQQRYSGDDFQVYRALRSINPSPYLFYCDLGEFRIFGSSPEAQVLVKGPKATVSPIAGTYGRSGSEEEDERRRQALLADEKESAEHAMLVDLARNDLSRSCSHVRVESSREVHTFSHLIHIVSRVVGTLETGTSLARVVQDTFPAGTLSGAPKHRAMQLLDRYEPISRMTYGGCVGFMGFAGDAVLGIMIRSFLSIENELLYQVGMGVVHDSDPDREIEECHTKIAALRLAIRRAESL